MAGRVSHPSHDSASASASTLRAAVGDSGAVTAAGNGVDAVDAASDTSARRQSYHSTGSSMSSSSSAVVVTDDLTGVTDMSFTVSGAPVTPTYQSSSSGGGDSQAVAAAAAAAAAGAAAASGSVGGGSSADITSYPPFNLPSIITSSPLRDSPSRPPPSKDASRLPLHPRSPLLDAAMSAPSPPVGGLRSRINTPPALIIPDSNIIESAIAIADAAAAAAAAVTVAGTAGAAHSGSNGTGTASGTASGPVLRSPHAVVPTPLSTSSTGSPGFPRISNLTVETGAVASIGGADDAVDSASHAGAGTSGKRRTSAGGVLLKSVSAIEPGIRSWMGSPPLKTAASSPSLSNRTLPSGGAGGAVGAASGPGASGPGSGKVTRSSSQLHSLRRSSGTRNRLCTGAECHCWSNTTSPTSDGGSSACNSVSSAAREAMGVSIVGAGGATPSGAGGILAVLDVHNLPEHVQVPLLCPNKFCMENDGSRAMDSPSAAAALSLSELERRGE